MLKPPVMARDNTKFLATYLADECIGDALDFVHAQLGQIAVTHLACALMSGVLDPRQLACEWIDCETEAEQLELAHRWVHCAAVELTPAEARKVMRRTRARVRAMQRRERAAAAADGPITFAPRSSMHAAVAKVLRGRNARIRIATDVPRGAVAPLYARRETPAKIWHLHKSRAVQ
jgi:hypothetical protein